MKNGMNYIKYVMKKISPGGISSNTKVLSNCFLQVQADIETGIICSFMINVICFHWKD